MRIISGEFGGRKIHPPSKMPHTRPTTDIAREGLFNILQNQKEISGIKSLDLFGGTGSISFELASRGAASLTIVEKDPAMHAFIKKTTEQLGILSASILKMDVFAFLKHCQDRFDFIFAGPPYALETIDLLPKLIVAGDLLNKEGWFVLEHTPRNNYAGYPLYSGERNYGTTIFSFFINR